MAQLLHAQTAANTAAPALKAEDEAPDARNMQARLWDEAEHDPSVYLQRVAALTGLRGLDAEELEAMEPCFDRLPFAEAISRNCVLIRDGDGQRLFVLPDPFDRHLRAWAMQRVKAGFAFAFCVPADLLAYLAVHESAHQALTQISVGDAASATAEAGMEISLATLAADVHPVIRLVNSSLYDALKARASDIHIESTATGLVIKYRIDGVLQTTASTSGVDVAEQVLSRLKVMADLDIGERRVPQDGRFRAIINQREIDFRVSNTNCRACCRFRSTTRRALRSHADSGRSCGTTRTRFSSAKYATAKRRASRCRPH
jgi:general secretion pathway protein E